MARSGDLSKRHAMKKFGIPRNTIAKRLKQEVILLISLNDSIWNTVHIYVLL